MENLLKKIKKRKFHGAFIQLPNMEKKMIKGTTTTLIADLEEARKKNIDTMMLKAIAIIKDRAENNEYHDFKSELPAPKINLFRDLQLIGLDELSQKAINGDYDELD